MVVTPRCRPRTRRRPRPRRLVNAGRTYLCPAPGDAMGIARLLLFSWQYPWHLRTLGDHPSHQPSTLFEDEDDDEYEDDCDRVLKTNPRVSGTTRVGLRSRGSRSKDRR
jgi:hypothetical protein